MKLNNTNQGRGVFLVRNALKPLGLGNHFKRDFFFDRLLFFFFFLPQKKTERIVQRGET